MKTLVYSVSFSPKLFSPAIAYTYARTGSMCGDIFKIFVNDADSELKDFLFLHECGHIVFAHSRNMELRYNKFLNAKIKSAYKKLSKLFPVEKDFMRMFENLLMNVVMDFEVNSRLFDIEEWNFMQERVQNLLNDNTARGFWPPDYGFPCGLCWNEYLNLILLNPQEFFVKHRFLKQIDAKEKTFSGVLSQEDYESFKKEYAAKPLSEDELKKLEDEAKQHEEATFGIPTGENGCSKAKCKPVTINFKTFTPCYELLDEVKKLLEIKTKTSERRDFMYNSNRRKFNTNVIIPKTIKDVRKEKAKLYILIDVSGSVEAEQIYSFIATFNKVAKHFKHTRIITWSTHLIDDFEISDEIPNHYGGGTFISKGIDYVNQEYSPSSNDVFFVISDFLDDLEEWRKSLNKMQCKKFAINWKPNENRNKFNPGFLNVLDVNGKKIC